MNQPETNKMQYNSKEIEENSHKPDEKGSIAVRGHIKISDVTESDNKIVLVDKNNAIHYENFSIALANSIGNQPQGWITEMSFGNGGSNVDPTGIITYLTPNTVGSNANLYNQTYYKNVDGNSAANKDPSRNFMEVRHITGAYYSDLLVTCLLDFGEPSDQLSFDNSTNPQNAYTFDELGLRAYSPAGPNTGLLLTHVIFHPVQKALNRLIQIDYTVRIQSLTNGM
jgi:hypothetical protein